MPFPILSPTSLKCRHTNIKQLSPFLIIHICCANILVSLVRAPVSAETIPKSVDDAMDKAIPSNGHMKPGISIRNGPVEDNDHQMPDVNGAEMNGSTSKRKSRGSLTKPSYAEADASDEDDQPLVRLSSFPCARHTPSSRHLHQEDYTDSPLDETSTNLSS